MDVVSAEAKHISKKASKKTSTVGSSSKDKLPRKASQHDPFLDDYMSPAEESDGDEDDKHRASNDLSAYLSQSISF
jgi:hypothetical protein